MLRRPPRPPPLILDSISESPEFSPQSARIDLGTESPTATPTFHAFSPNEWGTLGIAVNAHVPARRRSWRSLSFSAGRRKGFTQFQKPAVDIDCCICLEPALNPRKTHCCGKIFCLTHLVDWLKLNGDCPACQFPCSPTWDRLSSISPDLMSEFAFPTKIRSKNVATPSPNYSSSDVSESDFSWSSASASPETPSYSRGAGPELQHLKRRLPASAVASNIWSQEIGRLLIWIAFILVLFIIASPT